jgi:hypothetical protein
MVSSYNKEPKLAYYSLIDFKELNDYAIIKENHDIDFSQYHEVLTHEEFAEINIRKRRNYKISSLLEDF